MTSEATGPTDGPRTLVAALADRAARAQIPQERAGPLLLFGAGAHTARLVPDGLAAPPALAGRPIEALLDDQPPAEHPFGLPVLTPEHAAARWPEPAGIILSTDTHQPAMTRRARELFGPRIPIVDIYDGMAPGPYLRPTPSTAPVGLTADDHPTATCVRRALEPVTAELERRAVRRIAIDAPQRHRSVIADALRARGFTTTPRPEDADAEIAFDAFRGDPGPPPHPGAPRRVHLWSGHRPWIDRRGARSEPPEPGRASGERTLLFLPNALGDVVLAQGVLPKRIKTELDPDRRITFATCSAFEHRPGSAGTGWSPALCAHNPWIDEVIAIEPGPRRIAETWAELAPRFDSAYWLNQFPSDTFHMHDHLAMAAELGPGRTDAEIHLSDDDRALAGGITRALPRPLVGINANLLAPRIRGGWSEAAVAELCARTQHELGATVLWFGASGFGPYPRLAAPDGRALNVREQAAVMARCDVHVAVQGGGANLSGAVGCQTLCLTGVHPPCRESVALHHNPSIDDPSRFHVELSMEGRGPRATTRTGGDAHAWSLHGDPRRAATDRELALHSPYVRGQSPDYTDPPFQAGRRVMDLSPSDVLAALEAMLRCRRTGEPVAEAIGQAHTRAGVSAIEHRPPEAA